MRRIKKMFAVTLLALVVGLGTPTAFADGVAEAPGMGSDDTVGVPTAESSEPAEYKGVAEAPGFMEFIFIYIDVVI